MLFGRGEVLTSCTKYKGRRHVNAAANKLNAARADDIPLPMTCMEDTQLLP